MVSSSSLISSGLGNRQARAAGELVLGRQLVNLVLVAQAVHQLDQLPGELAAVVAGMVPEPLQLVELLVRHGPLVAFLAGSAAGGAARARPGMAGRPRARTRPVS